MAEPVLISTTEGTADGSIATITTPAGTTTADMLVVAVSSQDSNQAVTAPSGDWVTVAATGETQVGLSVFQLPPGVAKSGDYVFTYAAATTYSACSVALVRGPSLVVDASGVGSAASGQHQVPAVTTTVADCLGLSFSTAYNSGGPATAGAWSRTLSYNGTYDAAYSRSLATAATYAAEDINFNDSWAGITIAVAEDSSPAAAVTVHDTGNTTSTAITPLLPTRDAADTILLFTSRNTGGTPVITGDVTATPLVTTNRADAWLIEPTTTAITDFTVTAANAVWSWAVVKVTDRNTAVPIVAAQTGVIATTSATLTTPAVDIGRLATGAELVLTVAATNATATWGTNPDRLHATTSGNAALAIASGLVDAGSITGSLADEDRGLDGTSRSQAAGAIVLQVGAAGADTMVTNGSFELGTTLATGWDDESTTVTTPTYSVVADALLDGRNSQRVEYIGVAGDAGTGKAQFYQAPISTGFAVGDVVKAEIWLRGSITDTYASIGAEAFDVGTTYITDEAKYVTTIDGTYTAHSVLYTIPPATSYLAFFVQFLEIGVTSVIDVYADRATLTYVGPAPDAPATVAATAGDSQATVTWVDTVTALPTPTYRVEQSINAGPFVEAATGIAEGVQTYTATGLTNGDTIQFRVRVETGEGDSLFAESNTVTPAAVVVSAAPQIAATHVARWLYGTTDTTTASGGYVIHRNLDDLGVIADGDVVLVGFNFQSEHGGVRPTLPAAVKTGAVADIPSPNNKTAGDALGVTIDALPTAVGWTLLGHEDSLVAGSVQSGALSAFWGIAGDGGLDSEGRQTFDKSLTDLVFHFDYSEGDGVGGDKWTEQDCFPSLCAVRVDGSTSVINVAAESSVVANDIGGLSQVTIPAVTTTTDESLIVTMFGVGAGYIDATPAAPWTLEDSASRYDPVTPADGDHDVIYSREFATAGTSPAVTIATDPVQGSWDQFELISQFVLYATDPAPSGEPAYEDGLAAVLALYPGIHTAFSLNNTAANSGTDTTHTAGTGGTYGTATGYPNAGQTNQTDIDISGNVDNFPVLDAAMLLYIPDTGISTGTSYGLFHDGGGTNGQGAWLRNTGTAIEIAAHHNVGGTNNDFATYELPETGRWYMVGFQIHDNAGNIAVWVDGAKVSTVAKTNSVSNGSGNPFLGDANHDTITGWPTSKANINGTGIILANVILDNAADSSSSVVIGDTTSALGDQFYLDYFDEHDDSAAAGAVLDPDDTGHAHGSTSPDISISVTLDPDNSGHAHGSTEPALSVTVGLDPEDSGHGHNSTSPSTSVSTTIQPDDSGHANGSTDPTLSVTVGLSPDDSGHAHGSTEPALSVTVGLDPDDSGHAHGSTSPTISSITTLAPTDSGHVHGSTSPDVSVTVVLDPDDTGHAHGSTDPTLSTTAELAPDDSGHVHGSTSPVLTTSATLAPDDIGHPHGSTSPGLSISVTANPDNSGHAHGSASPTISTSSTIDPDDSGHAHGSTEPVVSVAVDLAPADSGHPNGSTSPTISSTAELQPASTGHAHGSTSPDLSVTVVSSPDNVGHPHGSTSPTLSVTVVLEPASTGHAHGSTEPLIVMADPPIITGPHTVHTTSVAYTTTVTDTTHDTHSTRRAHTTA